VNEVEDPERGFIEFSDYLYGFDVASSQTSILALLLGLDDLERITAQGTFNDRLVELAWRHRQSLLRPGYEKNDPRLRELVKATWMRAAYGSPPAWTALTLRYDTKEFGPGWQHGRAAIRFLRMVPSGRKAMAFLNMCRVIASKVGAYRGFGRVVLALHKAGARDIISNHDSWFCQLDDEAFRAAVDSATKTWFTTAFEPIYEALLTHLPSGRYRALVLAARAKYRKRVQARRCPRLALKPDMPASALVQRPM
jgi:hypothetical protein